MHVIEGHIVLQLISLRITEGPSGFQLYVCVSRMLHLLSSFMSACHRKTQRCEDVCLLVTEGPCGVQLYVCASLNDTVLGS